MTKRTILILASLVMLLGCGRPERPVIIFDTDLGNDVDDAVALVMLYRYAEAGAADILAEGLSKDGIAPALCLDKFNAWYGHPDIPFGIVMDGADCEQDTPSNYARAVERARDSLGTELFPRSGRDIGSLPEAYLLYRDLLRRQPDHSVTFVTVGFSPNLARLLETDRKLVARKTRQLVMMAGDFRDGGGKEYNVDKDVTSAQKVVREWPGPVVLSPFEVGLQVTYPAEVIQTRFPAEEPLSYAYKAYMEMPYDRPCWDPTALLYAVEGEGYFTLSPPGTVSVSDEGVTTFAPSPAGRHHYLQVDSTQALRLRDRIVELTVPRP